MSIRLIIYDLDGTLIDSRCDIANAVNWALRELGLPELTMEEISSFVGHGVTNLLRGVLAAALSKRTSAVQMSDALLERSVRIYRARYAEHLLDETVLYTSVRDVLEHFKGRRQAVITNKPEGFSRRILEGLGIVHYFFKIIGGDQAFQKKPSAEPVLEIVKAAQVKISEAVLVGDSAVDIETGKNAGIKTVAMTYGFGSPKEIEKSAPDFMFDDFRKLIRCPIFSSS